MRLNLKCSNHFYVAIRQRQTLCNVILVCGSLKLSYHFFEYTHRLNDKLFQNEIH